VVLKPNTGFSSFESLDVRVGTVMSAVEAKTKRPTYRMTIDFGVEIGQKTSCGAYTNYTPAELVGRQVVAIVNFGAKKMGPELSEVLVLGVRDPENAGTIFLTTQESVPNGSEIF
jgi:tRNA-binding protein